MGRARASSEVSTENSLAVAAKSRQCVCTNSAKQIWWVEKKNWKCLVANMQDVKENEVDVMLFYIGAGHWETKEKSKLLESLHKLPPSSMFKKSD